MMHIMWDCFLLSLSKNEQMIPILIKFLYLSSVICLIYLLGSVINNSASKLSSTGGNNVMSMNMKAKHGCLMRMYYLLNLPCVLFD